MKYSVVATKENEIQVDQAADSLPDIYYILLDGYANDKTLAQEYAYKNNSLTRFLRKNDFYIADSSRGNYLITTESLSSSLNYNYLDSLSEKTDLVYKNHVSKYLKEKGYKIIHINSGYAITRENYYADERIILNGLNEFERSFLKYTIFRLDDLIGYTHYSFINEQLLRIYDIIDIKGPKFTLIHIVSPHPPYVCDELGNFHSAKKITDTWWEPREDYLQQLKFINKQMENFIQKIILSGRKKKIIVLQSDHGPWIKDNSLAKIFQSRSRILNSYFIPYPFKNKIYSSITPVNSFRVIFNGLFKDSLPLLPDIPMDATGMKRYPQTGVMQND